MHVDSVPHRPRITRKENSGRHGTVISMERALIINIKTKNLLQSADCRGRLEFYLACMILPAM
jgi:hypothetical protein